MDTINREVGLIKNVLSPYDFDRLRMHFKNNPKLDSSTNRIIYLQKKEQYYREYKELTSKKKVTFI